MAEISVDPRPALTAEQIVRVEAAAAALDARREARLFVVRPYDKRLAVIWDQAGGEEWQDLGDDGEFWFVVIGRETTDERCGKLAQRFGLDADGLIGMRDDPQWRSCEVHEWGPLQ